MLALTTNAEAGFFSSILGDQVHAEAEKVVLAPVSQNLQTMEIPQASVSFASIKEGKVEIKEDIKIVSDNALVPLVSPSSGSGAPFCENGAYALYEVRTGDNIDNIAEMYEVTPDTILSANDHLSKGGKLKAGDFILIPPCPGVEYTVVKADTLQGIYNRHKDSLTKAGVSFNDFLAYNEITADAKIQPDEKLFLPGAQIQKGTSTKKSSSGIAKSTSISKSLVDVSGYFAHPLPNAKRRVRGIGGGHYGVDFAASVGTPIYAAASGTVKIARVGSMSRTSNGGYGTYVVITHPNGTQTWYAHMSKLGTSSGAQVNKGEVIGYVGSTGRSTGPHLHFEVKGAKNPF